MEEMVEVDLDEESGSSDFKSDSEGYDKEFDDIKIESLFELKHISKIEVSEPMNASKDPTFNLMISYKVDKDSEEQTKIIMRRYSELQWLDNQLQKSFPGWIIPSLPSLYDIQSKYSTKVVKEGDSNEIVKELSYNYNDYVTLTNYVVQVLKNERFRSCIKLKEFITNEEKIKSIANMDHDDPIFHNKIFKYLKSTGKSLLSYAWGTETPKTDNNIELKEKGSKDIRSASDKSAEELERFLSQIRLIINTQVTNLAELWSNIETLMKRIWLWNSIKLNTLEESKLSSLQLFFKSDNTLHEIYRQMWSSQKLTYNNVTELASHLKVNMLIATRKLFAKYKSILRAVDRLLDLCTDVHDLSQALPKYKDEPEKQETLRAEFAHYLWVLRTNFDYLREDSRKARKNEESKFKRIIEEYYIAQKMYLLLIKVEWDEVINI